MSVYYYKGAQILAPFTITSNEPIFDVDTVSLRKQRASQNAHRWEISFSTVGTPDTMQDMLVGSVVDLNSTATMVFPQLPVVDSNYSVTSDSVVVGTPGSIGNSSVIANGVGVTGTLPKGSFFKFSNHDKLYMTTADAVFTNGPTTVNFHPTLTSSVSTSNSFMLASNANFTYYRSIDNAAGITFSDGVLASNGTIDLVEAL